MFCIKQGDDSMVYLLTQFSKILIAGTTAWDLIMLGLHGNTDCCFPHFSLHL